MNQYKVGLFQATKDGVFEGVGGVLQEWIGGCVLEGYRMVGPALPVANPSGVYLIVTMELDDDHDADRQDHGETPSGFYEPIG